MEWLKLCIRAVSIVLGILTYFCVWAGVYLELKEGEGEWGAAVWVVGHILIIVLGFCWAWGLI